MDVLTTTQASLFYHLFVVLVLGLTILLALPYRKRLMPGTWPRAWVGPLVLLIFQAILLVAGGWGSGGPGAFARTSLGNLERAVSLASALVFGWIFIAPHRSRIADLLTALLLVLTGALAILFTYLLAYTVVIAPDLEFNSTLLAPAWEILRALTLLVMTVLLVVRPRASRGAALAAITFLLLGSVLQILVGSASGDLAGYTRLSELIAYPLLAYQVIGRLRQEAAQAPAGSQVDQRRAALETLPRPTGARTFPIFEPEGGEAERAAWAAAWIGQVANAQAALLLALDEKAAELRAVGGFDRQSSSTIPELRQKIAQDPFLPTVFQDGKSVRIAIDEAPPDLRLVLDRAGLDQPGSALLIPLPSGGGQPNAVLLTRARTSAPWTQEDQDALEWFAQPLSLALQPPDQLALRGPAAVPSHTASILGTAEIDHLRTRISELESELRRTDQTAPGTGLSAEEPIAAAEAWTSIETEAARLEEKLLHAIADREDHVGKLQNALLAARDLVSAAQMAPLESEAQGSDETAALRLALDRAEKELAEKRVERAAGSGGTWEVSGLPVVDRELVAALIKELHHPMSLAVSYADHLLLDAGRKDGGPSKKTLERVRASLARTNTLLRALEKVALIHDKDLPRDKGPLSVGEILETCLGSSRDIIKEKGLVIHLEVAEELSSVQLDPGILQQVAEHLIHNAALATPAHQAVEIRAVAVSVEGSLRPSLLISIHDSGSGIASEDYPRIFDRISRTAGLPIEGLGDPGVGLAVANILVQRIGGRLWLESAPDQGTTFLALFPFESG
ncbi:MAG: ATP-binding protein [Anaerolineales bacterium]|jgi:signal transduction histidine kinase